MWLKLRIKATLLLLAVVFGGPFVLAANGSENLLLNGSFEHGMEGWDEAFAGPNKLVEVRTGRAFTGERAVFIQKSTEDSSSGILQDVPVEVGKTYHLQARVLVDEIAGTDPNKAVIFRVQHRDVNNVALPGGPVHFGQVTAPTNGEWVHLDGTVTIPEGVVFLRVEVILYRAVGKVWVDDVSMHLVQ